MKALLILIVVAGGIRGGEHAQQQVDVREIEFSSLTACRKAAVQLVSASRSASDRARIFDVETSSNRVQVPGPVIVAECVQR